MPGSSFRWCGHDIGPGQVALLDGAKSAEGVTPEAGAHWVVLVDSGVAEAVADEGGFDLESLLAKRVVSADASRLAEVAAGIAGAVAAAGGPGERAVEGLVSATLGALAPLRLARERAT